MYKLFAILALSATVGCAPKQQQTPGTTPTANECNLGPTPAVTSRVNGCNFGWYSATWPAGSPPKSKNIEVFPRNCYVAVDGNMQCFFASPKEVCDAIVVMNDTIEQSKNPFNSVQSIVPISDTSSDCYFTGRPNTATHVYYKDKPARNDDPPNLSGDTVATIGVSGPYSGQFVPKYTYNGELKTEPMNGASFSCTKVTNEQNESETLRNLIIRLNKMANGGVVKSDLATFKYPKPPNSPCADGVADGAGNCTETSNPLTETANLPLSAQVHHIVPRTARNFSPLSCPWGKNSTANAAVISAQLNQVLSNANPPFQEIDQLNKAAKHPSVVLPP